MKNKAFTIAFADLNAGEQVIDLTMTYNSTTLKPLEYQITNSTGANLEYNFFTDEEYAEYQVSATNYDFIPFVTDVTIVDDDGKFAESTKFVVRKQTGETLIADLTGVFINFKNR